MAKYSDEQVAKYMDYVKSNHEGKYTPEQLDKYENYVRTNFGEPTILDYGSRALTGLGKVADSLRAVTSGPVTGSILEAATGEKVYDRGDVGNALNPSDLLAAKKKGFPSNAEMFSRAGLKNHSLSEVLPVYAEHAKSNPWYMWEKGGMLDPSVAGVAQVLTDPGVWLTGGEKTAAQNVLSGAVRGGELTQAAKNLNTAKNVISMGARPVAKGIEMLPGGKALNTLVNPLSALTRGTGKAVYGAAVLPAEHAGEKFGKYGTAEALYDAGAMTPFTVKKAAQRGSDALLEERAKRFAMSAAKGAPVDMGAALAPGFAEVARLRAMGFPRATKQADALEHELQGLLHTERGTPTTPGTPGTLPGPPRVVDVASPILDSDGKPFVTQKTLPGTPPIPGRPEIPGVPAKPYNEQAASDLKTYIRSDLSNPNFAPDFASPAAQRGLKDTGNGLQKGIEDSVERNLGKGQGAEIANINAEAGKLIGSQPAQTFVKHKAEREAANLTKMTGADAFGAGVTGAMEGPKGGLTAVAVKKALQALALGVTMPGGYATRKIGETNLVDRLRLLLQEIDNQKGTQNGQEKGK